jgi:hypothetical protein
MNPGRYKAKAVKDTWSLGETTNGNLELSVALDIKDPTNDAILDRMTHFFYFNGGAAEISFKNLRALGWKGNGADGIDNPDGVDANEVDVQVTQPEKYKDPKTGDEKVGASKVQILGGGRASTAKPIDGATFKARLKALMGNSGGSAPSGGGGVAPPF